MDDEPRPDPIEALAKAQEALRIVQHASALFRLYVERCNDPIVFINSDGTIIDANRRAELVFGFPQGEMVGKPIHVVVPERLRSAHVGHIARAMKNPRDRSMGLNMNLVGFNQSGYEFPVEVELIFYRLSEGIFASGTIKVIEGGRD